MYPFSNHNAKGFCTDLIEEAWVSSVGTIDVREAYNRFQSLDQRRENGCNSFQRKHKSETTSE